MSVEEDIKDSIKEVIEEEVEKPANDEYLDLMVDEAMKELREELGKSGIELCESATNKFKTRKELMNDIMEIQHKLKGYEPRVKSYYLKMNRSELDTLFSELSKYEFLPEDQIKTFHGLEIKPTLAKAKGKGRSRPKKNTKKVIKQPDGTVNKINIIEDSDEKEKNNPVIEVHKPNLKKVSINSPDDKSVFFVFNY